MPTRLSDYALIGNCRSAALVSKSGSIDWCCFPEFDSPAIFASILDGERGGYFSVSPVTDHESFQKYTPGTNVVETRFTTDDGEACLIDAFTVLTDKEKDASLFPDHEILRIVEGVRGTLTMKLECQPRHFYGKYIPDLRDCGRLGVRFSWKENIYTLLTTLDAETLFFGSGSVETQFEISAGDRVMLSLSYCSQSPAVLPELKVTGFNRMQTTITYWKEWIGRCTYQGLYGEAVRRSALILKLLTHAPSGAIIAAPTTSLPEEAGGGRNWDYRFCWLRDASFTTRVLVHLGFEEETRAYLNWIIHATALTRPELQVVYSVFGESRLKESVLPWLSGFRNSRPIRIGNGADRQFQLDIYGEVLDAAFTFSQLKKGFDRETKKFLIGLGKVLCKVWKDPDSGIWEVRSSPDHHTHSKVMAWVGLDRLVALCEMYKWKDAPVDEFIRTARQIKSQIEQHGYNQILRSYTRVLNGDSLDASSLTFSLVGFCDAASAQMSTTTERIYAELTQNNLVYRHRNTDDGLEGEEGAFGVCAFWLAENLAKSGRIEDAIRVFEATLRLASPTGLLSEEMDPETGELLGNYPQGFTHIGLINAAITISNACSSNIDNRL